MVSATSGRAARAGMTLIRPRIGWEAWVACVFGPILAVAVGFGNGWNLLSILLDIITFCKYTMKTEFEWDEKKNELNIKKHGIGFAYQT